MKLTHYSKHPVVLNRETEYRQGIFKPSGLWVSVDGEDDWPSWCKSENFRIEALHYAYRVELEEKNNILHLSGRAEIENFSRRFEGEYVYGASIDWGKVERLFQGIIIAPYCWSLRLELSWYYSWDCASGCIWDLSCVKAFEPSEVVA